MFVLQRRFLHISTRRCAPIKEKLEGAVTYYEKLIGLSDVKQAQVDVMKVSGW